MTTLREALQELDSEPLGSVLLEDNSGDEWLPRVLLKELESDDAGKVELARAVVRVERAGDDFDGVIAYVSPDGYEYPHEPRWYVKRPAVPR